MLLLLLRHKMSPPFPFNRYVYQETLGRWSALDLFFGLAFLARRDSERYPAADIAATGTPLAPCSRLEAQRLLAELRRVRRYMVYCQGLRHRTAEQQQRHWADALDTGGWMQDCGGGI
jgi:hypothetical protein